MAGADYDCAGDDHRDEALGGGDRVGNFKLGRDERGLGNPLQTLGAWGTRAWFISNGIYPALAKNSLRCVMRPVTPGNPFAFTAPAAVQRPCRRSCGSPGGPGVREVGMDTLLWARSASFPKPEELNA
jgi:hypothetical protein